MLEPIPGTETPVAKTSFIAGNKGLVIAVVIAVTVAVIGLSSMIGGGNSASYQGMIRQVEQETVNLQK